MNDTLGSLRCPACKRGTLTANGGAHVRCSACVRSFPRHAGYVDLLPPRKPPTLAQSAMQSRAIVRIYESRLWRRSPTMRLLIGLPFEREQALVQQALALGPSDTVLDLACGPGIYTRPIARALPQGRVIGLDMSPPMLAYACARSAEQGIPNLDYVRGDAMELPFFDATLHAVNCSGALHLFPDMQHAIREIHRVLAPTGRFVVAMARRPSGRGAELATRMMLAAGISPFGEDELERALLEGGFATSERHFGRRLWMIWSATKAA